MADRKILTHLDFLKASELQNALVHKLAAAPGSPVEGQLYYDTVGHKLYVYNGTIWVAADASQLTASAGILRTTNNFTANLDAASLEIAAEKIRIAEAAAGNGLGWAAGVLAVKVATPNLEIVGDTLEINTSKIATIKKAEELIQGIDIKASVKCATTANVIIASALLAGQKIDNISLGAGDRVLVKNQTNAKENGIYEVAAPPVRTTDADQTGELSGGTFTFVEQGEINADTGWVITTDGPVTIGTTEVVWTQFSGAGSFVDGDGLLRTGNRLDVKPGTGILIVSDKVAIDESVVATKAYVGEKAGGKFSANVGDNVSTAFVLEHLLGTRDVQVEVYRVLEPWDTVDVTVERTTENKVTVRFNTAPTTAQFRVLIRS